MPSTRSRRYPPPSKSGKHAGNATEGSGDPGPPAVQSLQDSMSQLSFQNNDSAVREPDIFQNFTKSGNRAFVRGCYPPSYSKLVLDGLAEMNAVENTAVKQHNLILWCRKAWKRPTDFSERRLCTACLDLQKKELIRTAYGNGDLSFFLVEKPTK